jgi:hypothetical protein
VSTSVHSTSYFLIDLIGGLGEALNTTTPPAHRCPAGCRAQGNRTRLDLKGGRSLTCSKSKNKALADPAATDPLSWTNFTSTAWVAFSIAVRPAPV